MTNSKDSYNEKHGVCFNYNNFASGEVEDSFYSVRFVQYCSSLTRKLTSKKTWNYRTIHWLDTYFESIKWIIILQWLTYLLITTTGNDSQEMFMPHKETSLQRKVGANGQYTAWTIASSKKNRSSLWID